MKPIGVAAVMTIVATALPARASLYFYNAGNTSGWSQLGPPENGGSIVDSLIAYDGSGGSVESTCVYHGQDGTRYHSEPRWNGNWNTGTTYFGYALYVAPDWAFSGPERHVTAQFGIASGPGKTPDDYQHWIKGDLLQMGVNGTDYTFGTMTAGQWHTVVMRFLYATNGQGQVQGWFDGQPVFEVDGISVMGGAADGEALWALGLYEADWFGGNVGPQTTRSVYNAKIAIGTTYADVDPSAFDAGTGSSSGSDSGGSSASSSGGQGDSSSGSSGGSSSGSGVVAGGSSTGGMNPGSAAPEAGQVSGVGDSGGEGPSGCGCAVAGPPRSFTGAAAGPVWLAVLAARRRRRATGRR
jgi:MYXO-CTERM domain-containing protein